MNELPVGWQPWFSSFQLAIEAEGAGPRTIQLYGDSLAQLGRYVGGDVRSVTRAQIEGFLLDLRGRPGRKPGSKTKDSTVLVRFRALKRFFKWLEEEGEFGHDGRSPMSKLRSPRVRLTPPPVLSVVQIRALLAVCEKLPDKLTPAERVRFDFDSRRDVAMIRLLIDTGMRRGEVATMQLEDVNLKERVIVIGRRSAGEDIPKRGQRVISIGAKAATAIDRYLRVRAAHSGGEGPWLWLSGYTGERMAGNGIYQMIDRRLRSAGITTASAVHIFRHTFSHMWLANHGNEGDLMRLNGWTSRAMVDRYGASAAQQRAIDSHKMHSPGDAI